MKKLFFSLSFAYSLIIGFSDSCLAQSLPDSIPLRVVILRHGEKPEKGYNLSCQGYNRSLALPEIFVARFGVPDFTYVPEINTGKTTKVVRMYQTLVPFAVKYNLLINSNFNENDSADIAIDILEKRGTVLIIWNSSDIPSIARSLGIKDKELVWGEADYDGIWIIDFVKIKEGKLQAKFSTAKQNINPSPDCK